MIYSPTGPELQAAIDEAHEWSRWFWEDRDYRMAEQWHLVAEELEAELRALVKAEAQEMSQC